jgi:TolB-like protein/DNA-binding winged helix-turn-helix (wHTH) protein/tetratricopeptide (TPR) repeat protein
MAGMHAGFYAFREFRLNYDGSGLFRVDEAGAVVPVPLGSRARQLLLFLIERAGQLLSKSDIMEAVWPRIAVEESNLTVQLSALRRALCDGLAQGRCIQTVPRRGYRFVAAVALMGEGSRDEGVPAHESGAAEAVSGKLRPNSISTGHILRWPTADRPAVAVLPFRTIGGGPDVQIFCDGLTDDIRAALARYPSSLVNVFEPSLTGEKYARAATHVGPAVDVRYAIEGSVRNSARHIRVNCRLVDLDNCCCIWSERFDRLADSGLSVQDEISEALTTAIIPIIAQAEQRRAMRHGHCVFNAWVACQRGLFHQARNTAADCELALHFFQQAIALDPMFSGGYRGMALAKLDAATQFQMHGLDEVRASAHALATRAIELESTDSASYTALASVLLIAYGDHQGALFEAERALALTPHLAGAHGVFGAALTYSGRAKEGLPALAKSVALDPYGPAIQVRLTQLIAAQYFAADYDAALTVAKRTLQWYPDHPQAHRWLAAIFGQLGRLAEAHDALLSAIAIAPTSFDMYVRRRVPWMRSHDHAQMVEGLHKAGWRDQKRDPGASEPPRDHWKS